MGIKDLLDKGLETGKSLAGNPADVVKSGIDRTELIVDKATRGKFSDRIVQVGDALERLVPGVTPSDEEPLGAASGTPIPGETGSKS